ncbi:unnamed protein product [Amoebophrya sp. A25]|nr:unnamed protein product [Amoebophrya sp. A25]|eukprot:GSA25T00026074001.1
MVDFLKAQGYPKSRTVSRFDRVSGTMSNIVLEDRICGSVVFGEGGTKVSIRPNATSTLGIAYGLDTFRAVSLRPRASSMQGYFLSGFLGTQAVVNDFLRADHAARSGSGGSGTALASNSSSATPRFVSQNVSIASFGVPKHQDNAVLTFSGSRLWNQIWFAFCFPVLPVAGKILREKESKIRDGMRMMGLRDAAFYLEDLVFNALIAIPVALSASGTLCILPDMVLYSSPFLIFLLFFFTLWHTLQFAVFLTSFFSSSLFGKIVCFGAVFMSLLFLELTDGGWETTQISFLGLFLPGCAFKYSMAAWLELELMTDGLTTKTIHWREDRFSVLDAIVIHVVGLFMYTFLFAYFDQVVPTEFGVPQPWYFPLTKAFWQDQVLGWNANENEDKESSKGDANDLVLEGGGREDENDSAGAQNGVAFEKRTEQHRDAERRHECVKVFHLRKEFFVDNSKIVAVDDFSTTMYKNEIYVLLGHNGAGKTTTFSMLTGLIPTTAGTSNFFGAKHQNFFTHSRDKVGICPQFSVLWPQLTALEHLVLFAMFKGVSRAEAQRDAKELLREQGMEFKKDALARTLSGGMRRKLSLAIAFTGNPSVVFLDEPSSGLDTSARAEMWNLLRTRKDGRVIVLTTHYMDEADALGDRIAIMSQGRIKCCGSPNFLKNVYGCGYNLSFTLTESAVSKNAGANLFYFLQETLKPHDVKLLSVAGKDMLFLVPFEASARFERAFGLVEEYRDALKIKSWNLYVCNLEEVFLKIASDEEEALAVAATNGEGGGSKSKRTSTTDALSNLMMGGGGGKEVVGQQGGTIVQASTHQATQHHALITAASREMSKEVPSRSATKDVIEKIIRGEAPTGSAAAQLLQQQLEREQAGISVRNSSTTGGGGSPGGSLIAKDGEHSMFPPADSGTRSGAGAATLIGHTDDHRDFEDAHSVSAKEVQISHESVLHTPAAEAEREKSATSSFSLYSNDKVVPAELLGNGSVGVAGVPAGKPGTGDDGGSPLIAGTSSATKKTKTSPASPTDGTGPASSEQNQYGVSVRRQMRALLWKRYLNARRDWITTSVQQSCPVLLVSLSIIFLLISFKDLPYRSLAYDVNFNLELDDANERFVVPIGFSDMDNPTIFDAPTNVGGFNGEIPRTLRSTERGAKLPLWAVDQPCPTEGGCKSLSSGASAAALLTAADSSQSESLSTSSAAISGSQCPAGQQSVYDGVLSFVFSAFQDQVDPFEGGFGGGGGAVANSDGQDQSATATGNATSATSSTTAASMGFATASGSFSTSSMAISRLPTIDQKNASRRLVFALEDAVKGRPFDSSAYGAMMFAENKNVMLHVNHTGYHSAPIMLQYFYNYLARFDMEQSSSRVGRSGSSPSPSPAVDVAIHPLPQTDHQKAFRLRFQSFSIAFNVMISFAFVSCFSLTFIVMEKELEIKTQQFINGVAIPTYWFSNYIFDFCTFIFPILSLLAALFALEVVSLIGPDSLPVFVTLMVLFAMAIPSFFYICAHFFRTAESALTTALVMNLIIATILFLLVTVFELMPFPLTRQMGRGISGIARLWPVFTFGEGVRRMALVSFIWGQQPPDSLSPAYFRDCEERYNRYEIGGHYCAQSMWDGFAAGEALVTLALQAVFYIAIAIAIDLAQDDIRLRQQFLEPEFNPAVNRTAAVRELKDGDVREEEKRIVGMLEAELARGGTTGSSSSSSRGVVDVGPEEADKTSIYFKNVSKLFRVSTRSAVTEEVDVTASIEVEQQEPSNEANCSNEELQGLNNPSTASSSTTPRKPSTREKIGRKAILAMKRFWEFLQDSSDCMRNYCCCCCCKARRGKRVVRDVHAVRDCSFALEKGDVFGLLGANGAGKTTTFRMMCGVTVPAKDPESQIRIHGNDIFTNRAACRKLIGYTSQSNPLWMGMTVREHLAFYAMVKGIPEAELNATVDKQMADLDLLSYVDKRATNLSGGNKRKLVIAMSLIGAPPILFLDEPSAGMDPAARRKLWGILHWIATKSKMSTVVLTSHSMNEVEALCSKLCIMTNGVFRCMGSLPRIKDLYGRGFDLYAKFRLPRRDETDFILQKVLGFDLAHRESDLQFVQAAALLEEATNRGMTDRLMELTEQMFGDALVAGKQSIILGADAMPNKNIEEDENVDSTSRFSPAAGARDLQDDASAMMYSHPLEERRRVSEMQRKDPREYLRQLLEERSSVFPHASRLHNKDEKTAEEWRLIRQDRVRLAAFAEWFLFALWRLAFSEFVHSRVPGARVQEQRQNVLFFSIQQEQDDDNAHKATSTAPIPLGKLFGLMEAHKNRFNVMEYAITPTTLEQIFNNFTYAQIGEDDVYE